MIINMYVTLMSVIFAGVLNMVFCKTKVYKALRSPIDGGKKLKDGNYIFGENKTWIGFFSMIVFGILSQVIWGLVCKSDALIGRNYVYSNISNTVINNILIGALFGFMYVICELPNSFVKRRINIKPGKTDSGLKGKIFFIVDQIDSLIGISLALSFLYPMPVYQFFLYILLGGITHITVNLILYYTKIRKNI